MTLLRGKVLCILTVSLVVVTVLEYKRQGGYTIYDGINSWLDERATQLLDKSRQQRQSVASHSKMLMVWRNLSFLLDTREVVPVLLAA